jgi:transposase, IS5 family
VITKNSGIKLGVMAFEGNPYDDHTLDPQLEQVSDLMGRLPKVTLVDRGYKGCKTILGEEIKMPGTGRGKTAYEKLKDRARFRRRATVEPVVGHLKSDYRMLGNYLKGVESAMINTIMAAVAFNMMKRLRQIRYATYFVLDLLFGCGTEPYRTVLVY